MGLFDDLFGKSKADLERENRMLKEMLTNKNSRSTTTKQSKKVLYQCRYCSYKSVRKASDGAPLPGTNNCPRHPSGVNKGPHSWMRTYLV